MSKLYYVQDNRQYVGNCVLWWAKGRNGYTCDLDKAHVFDQGEMERLCGSSDRATDVAWPKDEMDAIAHRHVDMQRLRREV